jgi:hypothetical protein
MSRGYSTFTHRVHEMSITADVDLQVSNKSKDMTYAQSVREKIQQIEIRGQIEFQENSESKRGNVLFASDRIVWHEWPAR